MKHRMIPLLLACCVVPGAWGQVDVSVRMVQEQFLPGEPITVDVRIANNSGQTLTLGEDDRWLRLDVQEDDDTIVARLSDVPAGGRFLLPSSRIATKSLNIEPHFALGRSGRYVVRASLWIREWDQTITSRPEPFVITQGTKLWERAFGLSRPDAAAGPPEVRKYLLQQATYLKSQIRLYARVTDQREEHTFGVVPIGPMVSFSRPRALVDGESHLHVLYQSGPRISTYCKISPEAKVVAYEKHEYAGTMPRLSVAEDGSVSVVGGVRVPAVDSEPAADPDPDLESHGD